MLFPCILGMGGMQRSPRFPFGNTNPFLQTLILFWQTRAALLRRSPWSRQPALTRRARYQSMSKGRVFSAEPPSSCINAALFRQLGYLFLLHFASINSFHFSPMVFTEDCGPINHLCSSLTASAVETSRFTHLHSPGWRLTRLASTDSYLPLYSEFSHLCLPTFEFLDFFPNAD